MKEIKNYPDQVKLTFYGGADAVTGSNFMLEFHGDYQLLVDCGLTQGSDLLEERNWVAFKYNPALVSDLIITHAHMDHIGLIGKLVAEGFEGTIYSTIETKALAKVMLEDGLKIMQYHAKKRDISPLWTRGDIEKAFKNWKTKGYHQGFTLNQNSISIEFYDAGHILGSAMARITYNNKSITFTGDLGNTPSPLLKNTESVENSNYLVMEAVYGNRNHQSRENRQEQLRAIIQRGIERGGAIVMPAFSLERTQMILYELNELIESGKLPAIPVFLDSPLAIKVLDIYQNHQTNFNDDAKADIESGDEIFNFPGLKLTKTKEESQAINRTDGAKLIIAGSGMSHAGRVLFHEIEYLDQADTTIVFIGYQSPGTVGRQLLEGNKHVRIMGRRIQSRAAVESLLSYSSHKDMEHLHEFAGTASKNGVEKIFVVLSEPSTAVSFSRKLQEDESIKASIVTPELAESITLKF